MTKDAMKTPQQIADTFVLEYVGEGVKCPNMARMVEAVVAAARAEQREADARIAEDHKIDWRYDANSVVRGIADKIRGQK